MDRVMDGLKELAAFVAVRHNEDPDSKMLAAVKRAEIEIERLRATTSPPQTRAEGSEGIETP